MQSLCGTRSNYKNRWRAKEDSLAHVGLRPRLCENSDLSIVRENPTAQNGPQSTIGTSGDILQLPKTRAVGVFTQPRSIAGVEELLPNYQLLCAWPVLQEHPRCEMFRYAA